MRARYTIIQSILLLAGIILAAKGYWATCWAFLVPGIIMGLYNLRVSRPDLFDEIRARWPRKGKGDNDGNK